MNLKTPINENYAGTIVKINNIVPLDNCSNVVHTPIFGNLVVVGKDTKPGDVGIFFPAETRLSDEYLHNNNLYRDNTQNKNIDEKGYFENNGRIKTVKFRGHKSEGIFMPLSSLLFAAESFDVASLQLGDVFDHINGIKICEKYVITIHNTPGSGKPKTGKVARKVSKLVDNQFRFHGDTPMLGKNMHRIQKDSLVAISSKLHGTSFVVGHILCKKKLGLLDKTAKFLGANIQKTEYGIIYSSRKVIKNDDLNKDYRHYYGEDLWKEIADYLTPYIAAGMTIYGEAVGYTRSGKEIQKGYDYGCLPGEMKIYVYRITITNSEGRVFEFSAKQVQDWCALHGILAVPQYYYGYAYKLFVPSTVDDGHLVYTDDDNHEEWLEGLLGKLLYDFNMEKDCELCKNKVPAEGIMVRIEGLDYEAYKLKSFRFRERESKELDKGEIDLESQESQEETQ